MTDSEPCPRKASRPAKVVAVSNEDHLRECDQRP